MKYNQKRPITSIIVITTLSSRGIRGEGEEIEVEEEGCVFQRLRLLRHEGGKTSAPSARAASQETEVGCMYPLLTSPDVPTLKALWRLLGGIGK